MSKEIADTIGGKRIAWLLAILAAFAVFAAIATQGNRQADAAAAGAFVITETSGNTTPGQTVTYDVSFTTSAATSGDLVIIVDLPSEVTVTGVTDDANVNCVFPGPYSHINTNQANSISSGEVQCTWNGPVPFPVVGSFEISATINQVADGTTVADIDAGACDNGDLIDGTACVAGAGGTFDVTAAELAVEKFDEGEGGAGSTGCGAVDLGDLVSTASNSDNGIATGRYRYCFEITNNGSVDAESIQLTDVLPFSNDGTASHGINSSHFTAIVSQDAGFSCSQDFTTQATLDGSTANELTCDTTQNLAPTDEVYLVVEINLTGNPYTDTNDVAVTTPQGLGDTASATGNSIEDPVDLTDDGPADYNSAIQVETTGFDSTSPIGSPLVGGKSSDLTPTDVDWEVTNGSATGCSITATGLSSGEATADVTATSEGTCEVEFFWKVDNSTTYANEERTVTFNKASNDIENGLWHLDPWDDPWFDGDVALRDDEYNLIGYQHTVCLDDDNGVEDDARPINTDADEHALDIHGVFPFEDDGIRWNIQTIAGDADINGVDMITLDIDLDGIYEECVRWYSTGAGEQNITLIDDDGEVIADWADDQDTPSDDDVSSETEQGDPVSCHDDKNNLGNPDDHSDSACTAVDDFSPLVKEWNVLDHTDITGYGNAVDYTNGEVDRPVHFDASTSTYESLADVGFDEHVWGTHAGLPAGKDPVHPALHVTYVIGADVTFTIDGTCGYVVIDKDGTQTVEGGPWTIYAETHDEVTVTSAGVPIDFWFFTEDCTSQNNSYTEIWIETDYPNIIGSNPVGIPDEHIRVNWVSTPSPAKQVFLAWAGQRVMIEHDWRLLPGDLPDSGDADDSVDNVGQCIIQEGSFWVQALKGGGPGNFLPTLEADVYGNDEAWVEVGSEPVQNNHDNEASDIDSEDDIPEDPQDSCISRFVYESEQPGQVDIEVFIDPDDLEEARNQTKRAVVIYYMKINRVETSLVTSVSKPLHNVWMSDWAPGNPWDYTLDETSTEWNVSKDLLVRVRVSGWFLNENPSGRPRDDSDPLNVLPADRWVMPDDWAVLAGGPADAADNSNVTGTAETFSPQYDIMIDPAGTKALETPEQADTFSAVAALTADVSEATATIRVNSAAAFAVGSRIRIDDEEMDVLAIAGTTLTVDRGEGGTAVTAHAAGTPVLILLVGAGFPFEGPYSLLDLPPLGASAALSDFDPDSPRDTMWADGDVDRWDAPMPPAELTVDIRGAGYIREVKKQDVYYRGTPNAPLTQVYPNPYYIQDIPASPFIPANEAGGGYLWDTWGADGPGGDGDGVYRHWWAIPFLIDVAPGKNRAGATDTSIALRLAELNQIRAITGDHTIGRTLVIYTDNHGEGMVEANGDFNLDMSGCAVNFMGGFHCAQGDVVGTSTIYATANYPDFRGKHPPVRSNDATVTWTWGGYKEITVEDGETEQFKYVVFHALDRDGFCLNTLGNVLLHPVLTSLDDDHVLNYPWHNGDPDERVDFLIDGGEGKIVEMSHPGVLSGEQGSAKGVPTFSTLANNPAAGGVKEFPTLHGSIDECQAWVKISSSLLDLVDVFIVAHDDEGKIGFDELIDFTSTTQYSLTFRWSLITWAGADGISPSDALMGTGDNAGGDDIFDQVTAIYGWQQAAQQWLGFFPAGVNVPGANDLTALNRGDAYWIAIVAPGPVTWTVVTDVN